ncbi:hypothetical protein OB952_11140 [Aeromonas salmonicida]|uniref:hypothetical protein n=1 Tax=Aeromonas salmonicida TaxID=645 RepID=UPI00259D6DDA|nr:hypothetical protein [Aeromonas salmonicida]MDM5067922.1 hypothetical protein [Aeromonas salmonicida]
MSPASDHPWLKAAIWSLKSSAVAMPAFAMAKVTLSFYTVVMVVQKEEVKRIHSDSELSR